MKLIGSYPNTRLRRNRKTEWSRRLVSENSLLSNDLIWPIFLTDGKNQKNQISTMPGVYRYSVDRIKGDTNKLINKKIKVSLNNSLKILFCIGETLKEKKAKKTNIYYARCI